MFSLEIMTVYDYNLNEIFPRIQGPLREILEVELAAGNSIQEISASWPMKAANIWLRQRFQKNYIVDHSHIAYRYLGDPKHWTEEYIDTERHLMIAVAASAMRER